VGGLSNLNYQKTDSVKLPEGEEMGYLAAKLIFQQSPSPTAIFVGDELVGKRRSIRLRETAAWEFPVI